MAEAQQFWQAKKYRYKGGKVGRKVNEIEEKVKVEKTPVEIAIATREKKIQKRPQEFVVTYMDSLDSMGMKEDRDGSLILKKDVDASPGLKDGNGDEHGKKDGDELGQKDCDESPV